MFAHHASLLEIEVKPPYASVFLAANLGTPNIAIAIEVLSAAQQRIFAENRSIH
jgi:hypothetical protein